MTAPRSAAVRRLPLGSRRPPRRTIYKCKGLVLCLRDTIVYLSAGCPGVSPEFAARSPFPAPTDLLFRANQDLYGCPWPFLSTLVCFLQLPLPEHQNHKNLQEFTQPLPGHSGTSGKAWFDSGSEPQLSTRVNFCARWPKTPTANGHSFLLH